jgi:XTP/dITP diphosphohydrolase
LQLPAKVYSNYHGWHEGRLALNIIVRFVSDNPHQLTGLQPLLAAAAIEVIPIQLEIEELQTQDGARLIRDKAMRAFAEIGRPLFVQHTGLHLATMNGLPGGLTRTFWDTLQAERFAKLFGTVADTSAFARCTIGYIDGQRVYSFAGELTGRISASPSGDPKFQWATVFIPEGQTRSLAELDDGGDEVSVHKLAVDAFVEFLRQKEQPECRS